MLHLYSIMLKKGFRTFDNSLIYRIEFGSIICTVGYLRQREMQ